MKTAISIPDSIFEEADEISRRLRISRSQLYSRAVSAYIKRHRGKNIRKALESVYASEPSGLDSVMEALQSEALREKW
jgi:antitoxin MazE6